MNPLGCKSASSGWLCRRSPPLFRDGLFQFNMDVLLYSFFKPVVFQNVDISNLQMSFWTPLALFCVVISHH